MEALTATQIQALIQAGGRRWTKSNRDRIYFNLDTIPGVEIRNPQRRGGQLTLDGETFSNRCETAIQHWNAWVDVATGETHAKTSGYQKVASEEATLVERFEALVADVLSIEEVTSTTADDEPETIPETIKVRIAEDVPDGKRDRLVRMLKKYHDATVDGDTITLPAEVWAPERAYGEHPTPSRYREIPRGRAGLVSQGNLVVVTQ